MLADLFLYSVNPFKKLLKHATPYLTLNISIAFQAETILKTKTIYRTSKPPKQTNKRKPTTNNNPTKTQFKETTSNRKLKCTHMHVRTTREVQVMRNLLRIICHFVTSWVQMCA